MIFNSNPVDFRKDSVVLDTGGSPLEIPNDFVWIFAGGIPPNPVRSKPPATILSTNEAALDEGLKKKPDHPPILLRLAELARDAKQREQAADSTNRDARLEFSRFNVAHALVRAASPLLATPIFSTPVTGTDVEGALADHPNQIDALYNIRAIHANLGKIDLARQY